MTPPASEARKGREISLTAALRDLNKLNAFVRVAERRSFTKAAADLRTTPSVLSKHMKELEDALGFSLFDRSTHGLVLTDAGEGLFQNSLQMLAKLDGYVVETRNLQKGPYGTLRIQSTSDYAEHVLAGLLLRFAQRHPGLRIHLFVAPEGATFSEEGFDVIVTGKKPALPGLIERDLGSVRHVVCASPKYFERCGQPRKPQELREHNCLINLSAPKGWPFRDGSRQFTVDVKGALAANSSAALVQMALQGDGLIRVPHDAVKARFADKTLQAIFEGVTASPERMRAYFSKARHLPAKTTEFIAFLQTAKLDS
jgi:DNA-binding transcriptional LysR family regulator